MERHDHYDAGGNLKRSVVVTRESPWDEYARLEAIADKARREGVCPDCGNPLDVCRDSSTAWMVDEEQVCYATAAREQVMRRREAQHKDEAEKPGAHWADGRRVMVRPASTREVSDAMAGKRGVMARK